MTQISLGLSVLISQTRACCQVVRDANEVAGAVLCRWPSISPGNSFLQSVTATATQRRVTSTQPCSPPARGRREGCVTTASTTLRARTASAASSITSGTGAPVPPLRRPASVSWGLPGYRLSTTPHLSLGTHRPTGRLGCVSGLWAIVLT